MKEKFSDYSNQQLKDLLKKNLQSMTGNKDDLIRKCADGSVLGRIPRCPKCFGGRYLSIYLDPNSISKKEPTSVQDITMMLISRIAILLLPFPKSKEIHGRHDCQFVIIIKFLLCQHRFLYMNFISYFCFIFSFQ